MSTGPQEGQILNKADIDRILGAAWDIAIRENPMFLASHPAKWNNSKLRKTVKRCLRQGMTAAETSTYIVEALLKPDQGGDQA